MKKILCFAVFSITVCVANSDIDLQKLENFGRYDVDIVKYNPFENVQVAAQNTQTTTGTVQNETIDVISIFNNKVYITNRWYKLNQVMGSYKVVKIEKNGVFLQKQNITKFYPLQKSSKSLIKLQKVQND